MSHSSPSRGRQASEGDETGVDPGRIKVGVGELAVATNGETLTTSGLGSCVAVGLVDRDAGVHGLLHAMLPSEDDARSATARPAKYVDAGIATLIEQLRRSGASAARLEARIAGGAEMLDLTDAVGPRNVERAEESLAAADVPIVASDVGDGVGRTVQLRADGGLVVRAADGFERTL